MGLFGFKTPSEKKKELLVVEANQFSAKLDETKDLPAISSRIILKDGEEAFDETESALLETRAITYTRGSRSGGAFRIAKGVYVGGSSGSSRSEGKQELKLIDKGVLILTNKRLVFDGSHENRNINLDKVISVNPHLDSVEVSTENRSKSMLFTVPNPIVWVFKFQVLLQAPDPHKLGKVNLTVNFK